MHLTHGVALVTWFLSYRAARERDAMRDVELAKLSELSLATDTKVLELLYASRVTRKEQLAR